MDESLRNIVAPILIGMLPLGNALTFTAAGRNNSVDACIAQTRAAKQRVRNGLQSAMDHGICLPFFTNDASAVPAIAFDLWNCLRPMTTFGKLWKIDTSHPADIDGFLARRVDPLDQSEMWQVYNAGEPCWDSIIYIENHVLDVAWWPAVTSVALPPRLRDMYPMLPRHSGLRGQYIIVYLQVNDICAAICFWEQTEDSEEEEDTEEDPEETATEDTVSIPDARPIHQIDDAITDCELTSNEPS